MAKKIDPEARRGQLARAALSIADKCGLSAVTVARVAEAAEVSIGHVQHWFPAKAQLMTASYEALTDRYLRRVDERIAEDERHRKSIRDMLQSCLLDLCQDKLGEGQDGRVRAEFHAATFADPDVAAVERKVLLSLEDRICQALENARLCGEAAAELDGKRAAHELLALTLGMEHLQLPEGWSREILGSRLREFLPHECRRHVGSS